MARAIKDVTPEQAAEILNAPQKYLQKLLDEGEIPFALVEGQVRIPLDALMEYKKREDAKRHQALLELVRLTEELGLYEREREELGLHEKERKEQ
jgi:excisionase family DNA binding protein